MGVAARKAGQRRGSRRPPPRGLAWAGAVSGRATQQTAGADARLDPVADDEPAVHDDVRDPDGVGRRALEGGGVDDRRGGRRPRTTAAQPSRTTPPVTQPDLGGRHAGELRDRRLQRKDAPLANVPPENARRGAVRPGVRNTTPQDRVIGAASLAVGAHGDPGHGHDRLDIALVHAVQDAVDRQWRCPRGRPWPARPDPRPRSRRSRPVTCRSTRDGWPRRRSPRPPSSGPRPRSPSRRCPSPGVRGSVRGRRGRGERRRRRRGRGPAPPAAGSWRASYGLRCTGTGPRRHPVRPPAASICATSAEAVPYTGARGGLEVADLQVCRAPGDALRGPGGGDGLVDGGGDTGRLVAHVGRVQTAPACGDSDDLDISRGCA